MDDMIMHCAICPDPDALLLDWELLIAHLADEHNIDVQPLLQPVPEPAL